MQYEVILHPVALIRPSEEVNMEHVIALTEEIARCQKWITPVPIEKHGDHYGWQPSISRGQ